MSNHHLRSVSFRVPKRETSSAKLKQINSSNELEQSMARWNPQTFENDMVCG
jgi:hypothetical protein